jgi:hypothetical protein
MVHTIETSNLNSDFEIQQLIRSLKHAINIIIRIRDTGCYNPPPPPKTKSRPEKGPKGTMNNRTFPPYGSSNSG